MCFTREAKLSVPKEKGDMGTCMQDQPACGFGSASARLQMGPALLLSVQSRHHPLAGEIAF